MKVRPVTEKAKKLNLHVNASTKRSFKYFVYNIDDTVIFETNSVEELSEFVDNYEIAQKAAIDAFNQQEAEEVTEKLEEVAEVEAPQAAAKPTYKMLELDDGHLFYGLDVNVHPDFQQACWQELARDDNDLVTLLRWARQLNIETGTYEGVDKLKRQIFEHIILSEARNNAPIEIPNAGEVAGLLSSMGYETDWLEVCTNAGLNVVSDIKTVYETAHEVVVTSADAAKRAKTALEGTRGNKEHGQFLIYVIALVSFIAVTIYQGLKPLVLDAYNFIKTTYEKKDSLDKWYAELSILLKNDERGSGR